MSDQLLWQSDPSANPEDDYWDGVEEAPMVPVQYQPLPQHPIPIIPITVDGESTYALEEVIEVPEPPVPRLESIVEPVTFLAPAAKPAHRTPRAPVPVKAAERRTAPQLPVEETRNLSRFTGTQLRYQYKAGNISKETYKSVKKDRDRAQTNTRYTSIGGFAFTLYLLAYPAVFTAGLVALGNTVGDAASTISSLDWSIEKLAGSISSLQSTFDLGARYVEFRYAFITAVVLSSLIPFVTGIVGATKKKGRVWAVATIALAVVFNPAIVAFGSLTNLSWWVIAFG